MNTRKFRHTYTAIAATAILATTVVAWAANPTADADRAAVPNDAMAIASAKISLTQAIATAEQHAGGNASKAEYERTRRGGVYEVEVVSGAKVMDVKVDAAQGTVISSKEDEADHDRDRDDDHHDRDHDKRD